MLQWILDEKTSRAIARTWRNGQPWSMPFSPVLYHLPSLVLAVALEVTAKGVWLLQEARTILLHTLLES